MAKIATMRGFDEGAGRGFVSDIPVHLYFDFSKYTEGEQQLLFLREKAKLLQAVYPDSSLYGEWDRSVNRINDAVYKGLANFNFTGLWRNDENTVARAISLLKNKVNPANGLFLSTRRNGGVSGTDPLVPLEDGHENCKVYLDPSVTPDAIGDLNAYESCLDRVENVNFFKRQLNDPDYGLEKTSLQFLYNWATPADLNNEDIDINKRFKMIKHREHILGLAQFTGLSAMNIQGWISLGIMRRSALNFGEVLTPENVIDFLKTHLDTPILFPGDSRADDLERVGLFTIIAIAVLVLAAFIGVAGLVQVLKNKEPTAFSAIPYLSGLAKVATGGVEKNSPGGSDWIKKAGTVLDNLPTGGTKPKTTTLPGASPNDSKDSGFDFSLNNPLVIGGGAALLAGGIYLATK